MNTPQILRALAEAEEHAAKTGAIDYSTGSYALAKAEKLREIADRIERNEVDITKQPTIIAMATEMFSDTDQPSVVNPLSHEQSK